MYTNILKFLDIKRTMCLFIHIFSMYTHILTIKRNYVNNKTHIFYVTTEIKIKLNLKQKLDTHFHNTQFLLVFYNEKKVPQEIF